MASTPSGFFALRTPLLPWRELLEWTGAPLAPSVASEDLEHALETDRAGQRARLRAAVLRPEVAEAIFLASPSLHESIPSWLRDPDGERGIKVERALVRYFARMAGRATPFGLFAGCSMGTIGASTRLALAPRAAYRRHTRLDMDYVSSLVDALAADQGLRAGVPLRPNSSVYRAAGRLRYAEARTSEEHGRSYHLVAVEPTEYLDRVLEAARPGARAGDLAALLVSMDPEITREEADDFVDELIDSQLLVPDLAPPITGPEAIHALIDSLRPLSPQATNVLEQTREALAAIDAEGVGRDPDAYLAIAARLGALPAPVKLPRLFQVDMTKPCEATLGPVVVAELSRAVDLLARLAVDDDPLARFREAFERRYETRAVPLLEALDNEIGVGLGDPRAGDDTSPLLAGLPLRVADETGRTMRPRDAALLRLADRARRTNAISIELDAETIRALENPTPPPLPASLSIMASIGAASAEAADRGELTIHVMGAHASGARLLGRFCHADPALAAAVRAELAAEEARREDAIFAEVVHLPEGRTGNVLQRPLLRAWELPYLGRSGAPEDRWVGADDLLVSVERRRVVLRSARHGREVIPRLTTAHNVGLTQNLLVYRFLGMVIDQDGPKLSWDWGGAAPALAFLPRLTSGRLVLSLARWNLEAADLAPIAEANGRAAPTWRAVQALRASRRMPRFVCLADWDNELPVDLDNALSVDTFAQLVKGRTRAVVIEQFPLDELCVEGPEGRFDNEIVVPLRSAAGARESAARREPAPRALARRFPPGSEWLYAKLYGGVAGADRALRQVIAPLVREHGRELGGWFFVRYADPDDHLRVRFQGDPAWLASVLLPALHRASAPLFEAGELWRLQLDSYEREVERYGGPEGIELAERIFQADSEAALAITETLAGDEGADARWRLALAGVDRLLDDFGLGLETKQRVVLRARDSYRRELRSDALLERQIGERFRRERPELEETLAGRSEWLAPGLGALAARSAKIAPLAHALRAAPLTVPLEDLVLSFAHMQCDRLLRDSLRAHELVIHDFLHRIYEGRIARARR